MADGVIDIDENEFIRKPTEDTFDPEKYEAEFQKKVQELDIIKGELKRDIVDYQELKQLTNNDVLNLQALVIDKLEEIEDSIRRLKEIGDKLTNDRRDIFSREMTPDEIREFGKQNKLPKNVIYKMLEKYHYMKFYKYLKKILEDDKIDDKEIEDLSINEAPEYSKGTMALAFGRFNPPTIGHEKLLRKVSQTPGDFKHVYLSKSQDSQKNPLTPTQKIKYMRDMFPQHRSMFRIPKSNMILDIATEIYNDGYTNINFVAGSDRVQEFKTILNRYNNVKSRHGFYNFKNIKVISAGERDPDAEGATGMSASKMRKAVAQGDLKSFEKGLPRGFRGEKDLFRDVAKGMRIDWKQALAANYGMRNHYFGYQYKPVASLEDFDKKQLRDLYIREVIFNIGDKVHYVTEDVYGKIVRRSTNYIVLEDENDNLHKAWIYDCIPESADKEVAVREFNLDVDYGFEAVSEGDMKEKKKLAQDPDVRKEPGSQPKKYYKTLSKDVKQKRSDFFKKQDTTDTSPDSYKKAPGDETGKTKPSKHTQKYKKMFGELKKDLNDACWSGYKQVGMKKKGKKMVPNCVPENVNEATHDCPPAVKNVDLNTKNRDLTTQKHNYGPLNVDEPGDYWQKIAKYWKTSEEAAKQSLCGNCVAFDISPRMDYCMPGETSDDDGRLGYCWMHHFKCHSARSCHTWAKGGPITKDEKSHNWQERGAK